MNELTVTANTSRVSPIRAFAEEGNLGTLGKIVEFKKGQWSVDDRDVEDGLRFVADMGGGYRCVVKWFDGRPVDGTFQLASIALGETLPFRSELGDFDETKWEDGMDGKPKDPWAYGHRQILKGWEDGAVHTFRTSSWGGKRAMQLLYGEYDREKDRHPGQFPVVELNQEKVTNKTFGPIPEPRFPIVGWRTLDGGPPALEATPDDPRTLTGEDMTGDEIPGDWDASTMSDTADRDIDDVVDPLFVDRFVEKKNIHDTETDYLRAYIAQ